jgi:hypothetical protein
MTTELYSETLALTNNFLGRGRLQGCFSTPIQPCRHKSGGKMLSLSSHASLSARLGFLQEMTRKPKNLLRDGGEFGIRPISKGQTFYRAAFRRAGFVRTLQYKKHRYTCENAAVVIPFLARKSQPFVHHYCFRMMCEG